MIFDAALREAASGRLPLALVTIATIEGSGPRHAGSRMAIRHDGTIVGTVGGGLPEARAIQAARDCLASGENAVLKVEMTGASATGVDLICGGVAEMWIEVVTDASLYAAAQAAVDRGESVLLVSSATDGCVAALGAGDAGSGGAGSGYDATAIASARERDCPILCSADGLLYAKEEPPERLLILGGGHVGLALARAAAALSFRTTVVDPRPEFSDSSRFPAGVECATRAFVEAIEEYPFSDSTYVVVVSPGHLGDLECARAVLVKPYKYLGLIGSRRKSRMLKDQLLAEGFDPAAIEELRTPIGLSIGAETPEEIAVSILAEMIAVRRGAQVAINE
jgi:xanthine dehydrogenase accessory factor